MAVTHIDSSAHERAELHNQAYHEQRRRRMMVGMRAGPDIENDAHMSGQDMRNHRFCHACRFAGPTVNLFKNGARTP